LFLTLSGARPSHEADDVVRRVQGLRYTYATTAEVPTLSQGQYRLNESGWDQPAYEFIWIASRPSAKEEKRPFTHEQYRPEDGVLLP